MRIFPVFKAFQMYLNWISSLIYRSGRAEFGKQPDVHKPLMASQETDGPKALNVWSILIQDAVHRGPGDYLSIGADSVNMNYSSRRPF